MKFNTGILRKFREDFEQAVKPLEEKFKVTIKCGKITYGDNNFSAKIEATTTEGNFEQEEFEKYARLFGFDKDDYGKTITLQGNEYAFVGFNLGRPKYRCKIRNIKTGQEAAATEASVKNLLKKGAS